MIFFSFFFFFLSDMYSLLTMGAWLAFAFVLCFCWDVVSSLPATGMTKGKIKHSFVLVTMKSVFFPLLCGLFYQAHSHPVLSQ